MLPRLVPAMQLLSASRPGPPAPDQGGRVGGTGADSLSHSREKRRDVEVLPGVKLATMSPSRLVRCVLLIGFLLTLGLRLWAQKRAVGAHTTDRSTLGAE
jgi:hypothetical protein